MIRTLESKILGTITQKDERDLQKKVGPSDLSNQCEVCLASKLFSLEGASDGGNLATWLGTAFHEKLERDERDPTIIPERKVTIATLNEAYGVVKGTSDRYDSEFKAVVDYKGTSKDKLKKLKNGYISHNDGRVTFTNSQLFTYYVQLCLYGLGVENEGEEVEKVAIFFVPRDSTKFRDCHLMEFPYNRDLAEQALDRARAIYDHVTDNIESGRDPLDDLESDPDCWNCRMTGYR